VGFKYIGELINEDKIILGGEESAGLSIKGHYPEKDGLLACLLAAEAVAARRTSLTDQLEQLFAQVGRLEGLQRIGPLGRQKAQMEIALRRGGEGVRQGQGGGRQSAGQG